MNTQHTTSQKHQKSKQRIDTGPPEREESPAEKQTRWAFYFLMGVIGLTLLYLVFLLLF